MLRVPARIVAAVLTAFAVLPTVPARAGTPAATETTASAPGLGVNLSAPDDWTTEWPFVDLFRTSRDWISQRTGAAWGKGPAVSVDADGWVTRLEKDSWVEAAVLTGEGGRYPAGKLVVTWTGRGQVSMWGDGKTSNQTANRFEFEMGKAGNHFVRITATDPADYVRDIHVWLPGFEQTGAAQEFHPQYLQRLRGMRTLRFMDWINTNNSTQVTWSQYPTERSARQSDGVAPQIMARLANRVGADPWFTMPHLADADWVRQFATVMRDTVDPDRKIYVEYSNEVWNGQFQQSRWAQQQGVAHGMFTAGWEWQAALHWQARRSVEVFRIWRDVFGADADRRLVRVLAAQAANPVSGEAVVSWQDAYKEADAVAIAPYFTCDGDYLGTGRLTNPGLPAAAPAVLRGGVTKVLDNCQRAIDTEIRAWITGYRALAARYGLALIGYEGGQHLVGVLGGEQNTAVNAVMYAANRSGRMRDLYAQYLSQWRELGGGALVLFASGGPMTKFGSWGLVEYEGQPVAQAPKYLAVDEAMQGLGQRTATIGRPAVTTLSARSGLAAGGTTLKLSGTNLASASAVRFGTVRAPFQVTGAQLTVTVPPNPTGGVVAVTVENPAGVSASTAATAYTYQPPPVVDALSTATASVVGGTRVTVTGSGLTGATRVSLGGTPATDVQVVSATSLRFTAPPRAAGQVDVTVTTPYGVSRAVRLTYLNPPRPVITGLSADQGPSNAATTVVITGTDLTGASRVSIGKAAARSFTVLSATQIRAVLPPQPAGTWENVQVTTPGGPSFGSRATEFRYVEPPKPVVTALSANQGRAKAATTVVLTGTNLTGVTRVTVAGVAVRFVVTAPDRLTLTVPPHAAGSGHVLVTTANGTSAAAGDRTTFTWQP